MEAALLGHPALRRHIDLAGRILADNDHGQAGHDTLAASQFDGKLPDPCDHVFRNRPAVDDFRHC